MSCSTPEDLNATLENLVNRSANIEKALSDIQGILLKLLDAADEPDTDQSDQEDTSSESEDTPPLRTRHSGSRKRSTRSSTRK